MKIKLNLLKVFLALFFALPAMMLMGQHTKIQDYNLVILNDGSKLKAKSVELTTDKKSYLIVLNVEKEIEIEIEVDDVKKIKSPKHVWEANSKGQLIPVKGKYTQIMIGVNGNSNSEGNLNIGLIPFQFSMGLQFHPKFSVGAGFSLDTYNRQLLLPIFLESKYYLATQSAASPYLGLRAGMGPHFSWGHSGGGMLHPHIGIRQASKSGQQFVMEFGVKMQQQFRRSWESVQRTTYNRYTLSMGISF